MKQQEVFIPIEGKNQQAVPNWLKKEKGYILTKAELENMLRYTYRQACEATLKAQDENGYLKVGNKDENAFIASLNLV